MAYIDDQPVDFQHPDQGILIEHGRGRPIWIHGVHPQQVADLLGFGLHGTRTQGKVLPDLACRQMGGLGRIEKKVDHVHSMDDPTGPGGSFALHQRREPLATQGGRQLAAELRVLLIQVGVTEGVGRLGVISSKRACISLGTCCEVLRLGIASSFCSPL